MNDFSSLTPDHFLPALEEALGYPLTSFIRSFPSYINRVVEVRRDEDDVPLVAKFYRPGRWTREALLDEHAFLFDCVEAEIPVVPPLKLSNGQSLGQLGDISFALFEKKAGRIFDIEADESWQRVGSLLGRLHTVGQKRTAPARIHLDPITTTRAYAEQLADDDFPESKRQPFLDLCNKIVDTLLPYFKTAETVRVHGDFHTGNILERPGTGLMVIDFDDMMNGTPVQDFWLLLPDHYPACSRELSLVLKGYRQWRNIDDKAALLIEGLRAMRLIYFNHWCHMQREDFQFQTRFPDWGSEPFWAKEIQDLRNQYSNMLEALHRD